MLWADFYYNYSEWAESTIRSRISSLKEIGNQTPCIEGSGLEDDLKNADVED